MTDDREENKHCDKAGMRPGSAVDRKDGLAVRSRKQWRVYYGAGLWLWSGGSDGFTTLPPSAPPCVL